MSITYKDTTRYVPPITGGIVVKVYDGDTITIASKLPYDESPLYRFSVRIYGLDCAEMRTSNEREKSFAEFVQETLSKKIMGKYITLTDVDLDKYGRVLANVHINDENITQFLIEQRMAVPYYGGKKETPDDWWDYYDYYNFKQT